MSRRRDVYNKLVARFRSRWRRKRLGSLVHPPDIAEDTPRSRALPGGSTGKSLTMGVRYMNPFDLHQIWVAEPGGLPHWVQELLDEGIMPIKT